MRFVAAPRDERSFQRPVSEEQLLAMSQRVLGPAVEPVSAEEIAFGTYNSTYSIQLADGGSIILRVAPEESLQLRSEYQLMRNEHAGVPFLAPIAPLLPRSLGVDFTREVINRDYLFQTRLEGVAAPIGLERYERTQWRAFYRGIGSIARAIHGVRGDRFGTIAGESFDAWSAALRASLDDILVDHHRFELAADDVRELRERVTRHQAVLDQITVPRLLHGDLWTVNLMIDSDGPEPRITGLCDCDRLSWGDPLADWPIFVVGRRPDREREGFWESYGREERTPEVALRSSIYAARHLLMARLERFPLGKTSEISESYEEVATLLAQIPG